MTKFSVILIRDNLFPHVETESKQHIVLIIIVMLCGAVIASIG